MTTTATERPTLSRTEARALPVGTRVEYRRYSTEGWVTGTIADSAVLTTRDPESASRYALIRSDGNEGWPDGGSRYWFADSDHMVRLIDAPDAFTFGQTVTARVGGETFTGIVRGKYAPEGESAPSWLVCADDLPRNRAPYASHQTRTVSPRFTYAEDYPRDVAYEDAPIGVWVGEAELSAAVAAATEATTPTTPAGPDPVALRVLRIIGEAMAETSDRHEWCGEYERILDNLIDTLPSGEYRDAFSDAAHRDREYRVAVEWTVSGTYYVNVTASSEDAAVSEVQDDPSGYVDWYSLRGSVDSSDVEFGEVYDAE